jgi:hypothetical protein
MEPVKNKIASVVIKKRFIKDSRFDIFLRALSLLNNEVRDKTGEEIDHYLLINLLHKKGATSKSLSELCKDGSGIEVVVYDDKTIDIIEIKDGNS